MTINDGQVFARSAQSSALETRFSRLNNVSFHFKKSVQLNLIDNQASADGQSAELQYALNTLKQIEHNDSPVNSHGIDVLPEYQFVKQLIEQQFPVIFMTGGAGTGKSTFIQWLCRQYRGKVLLGAPTAMAALNVGGKTLHSLFQLPPGWIVKQDIKQVKKREVKKAQVLIIDEISMVTSNLLDGISAYLRLNRGVDKSFGGLTVVMVGDLFQLPPVIDEKTRDLFVQVYGSPKFYNARCLKNTDYCAIELTHTYRQTQQDFVQLLCNIREGQHLASSIDELNQRCLTTGNPPIGAVWLSPRNSEVEQKNQSELAKIALPLFIYTGELTGEFKSDRLPSPLHLKLKVGAQVMFTQNDPQRRWLNGTVGQVTALDQDKIMVSLRSTGEKLAVERVEWLEYHYQWNATKQEIERIEIGSYSQFPLVLSWAMTIHKSQGRTIDKVHLELGKGAFETGQTYVALSRCRTMEGLSFSRPLRINDVFTDIESTEFYRYLRTKSLFNYKNNI
ncbi:ATP-dependent RecD-like DNA helicase [Alkanindiges sp. WGS2144]|uniref:ATP-dependent DNA helicase n=1 Tax=Alkanindiges sp. WGS2144 TaxID=3366808 RepID=UPI0037515BF2